LEEATQALRAALGRAAWRAGGTAIALIGVRGGLNDAPL